MKDNLLKSIKETFSEVTLEEFKKNGELRSEMTAPKESLYGSIINQYKEILKKTNYIIHDGRLCYKKFVHEGEVEYIPLCNFLPFVTQETIEDDGMERKVIYHINGVLLQRESILPEIHMPAENFSTLNWPQTYWGIRANVEPGHSIKEKIRHAIQSVSSDCPRDYIYTHLGWRKIYDEWIYIHAGGAIGKENVAVKLESNQLEKYVLPTNNKIDVKEAAIESLELLKTAELEVTLPLMAMVGLAPLCQPLKTAGIEPAFVLWLNGPSGSKKSSIVACYQCFFGTFKSGKDLPASFRDTMNAIEKKAFITKDSVLVIDDYHPTYSSQESKRMEQIAQQILRGYGDRVGRSRMNVDTSLGKSYPPRGLCLITGEDTPKAGISTSARFLEVELTSTSVKTDILRTCQNKSDLYKYAYKGYIEWLLPQMNQLPNFLKSSFNDFWKHFSSIQTHGRIIETIAWLSVGLDMLLTFYTTIQAIDHDQKDKIMDIAFEIFSNNAKRHSLNLKAHDPVMLFIEGLRDLINMKAVSIINCKEDPYTDDRHFIGWEDHEFYYLIIGSVMNEINQYFHGQDLRFPVSKHMLLKLLAERHMIVVEEANDGVRKTVRACVGNEQKQKRVMKLRKSVLL